MQAVDALMGPRALAAIFTALWITGALQEMTDFYDQRTGLCFEWAECITQKLWQPFWCSLWPRLTYPHTPRHTPRLEAPRQSEACHCGRRTGAPRYHKAPTTTPSVCLWGVVTKNKTSGTFFVYSINNESQFNGKLANKKKRSEWDYLELSDFGLVRASHRSQGSSLQQLSLPNSE